jgi:hypothetical protein
MRGLQAADTARQRTLSSARSSGVPRISAAKTIWHEKWQFNGSLVAVLWQFLA